MNAPIRVLIVDDDRDDFVLTREALLEAEPETFVVSWAAGQAEGIAAYRTTPYDVILLDYFLGATTGLEFMAASKAAAFKTTIIMLTGQSDATIDLAAMRAGADDYVIKSSLRGDTLARTIRYAIERRQTQERIEALNQQLMAEQGKLIRSDRLASIGLLAASIAHEVNNPLAGVMACTKALRDQPLDAEKRLEYLDTILEGLGRIKDTVQGLLDYTRDRPVQASDVEVRGVVHDCLLLLGHELRKKRLVVDTEKVAPVTVRADRSNLLQVLMNVLINAIYASPEEKTIRIVAAAQAERIAITVIDQGVGISAEIKGRIFEPWFSTKPEGQGTGLGLAICKNIVRAHKGEMTVESEVGVGTTLTVLLPAASANGGR